MKKIFSLAMILVLGMTLVACKGKEGYYDPNKYAGVSFIILHDDELYVVSDKAEKIGKFVRTPKVITDEFNDLDLGKLVAWESYITGESVKPGEKIKIHPGFNQIFAVFEETK